MVNDSATSTSVVNKDDIDLILQTEFENQFFHCDGIEAVHLNWFYRACVHPTARINHRAVFAESRHVDTKHQRIIRHRLGFSDHRRLDEVCRNELCRARARKQSAHASAEKISVLAI